MKTNRLGNLLLVEDEHRLRGLVAQFLRGEGYQVVEAGDGPEGVERFADSGPFDLVLVDLNLPVFSGVEVCRRIKRARPDQRIMVCSAAILGDHERALAALGVDHYLTKPYHPEDLIAHIARRSAAAASPAASTPPRCRRSDRSPTPSDRARRTRPSGRVVPRWQCPRSSITMESRQSLAAIGEGFGTSLDFESLIAKDGFMAGKPLNRLELRRQNDAAEPLDPMEDEADDLLDDADDDDGQERKAKKKKAPAKKAKAVKAAKPAARMRIVWTVMNDAFKPVGTFEYAQKEAAEARAAELTAKGKGTHFVQKTKEPMPDNAPGLGAAIPRPVAPADRGGRQGGRRRRRGRGRTGRRRGRERSRDGRGARRRGVTGSGLPSKAEREGSEMGAP